jgi:hypothetical protein
MAAPAHPLGLRRYAAPAAALLLGTTLALTGCSGGDGGDGGEPAARESARSPSPTPADSADPTDDPGSESSSPSPVEGGTAERPVVPTAATRTLDWQRVPGPVDDAVTRSGEWTLRVDQAGTTASLEGPDSASGFAPGPREKISDALIDGDWAVVVTQDEQETRPSSAQVYDLRHDGRGFTVDGSSDVPTTTGGTWALGDGTLLHATIHRGSYCMASVDLASRKSTLGWCAPKRHGFNSARITPAGQSLLTFDDSRPACRTVVQLDGADVAPFDGVPDCKAWDGLVTDDGAVWSVIPREREVETAEVYARSGDGWFDLGPATSGTLTWCGDAAYFVRDPQRDKDPARLMRWNTDDGLETVYETTGGNAFVEKPRCGGETITVTARAQSGDEQVSAPAG